MAATVEGSPGVCDACGKKYAWLPQLAATAVFAAAVFAVISSLDMKSARGPILAWHITILVYLVAFKTMFDLDLVEALMTSAVVGVLLALASIVIFQAQP